MTEGFKYNIRSPYMQNDFKTGGVDCEVILNNHGTFNSSSVIHIKSDKYLLADKITDLYNR